MDADARLSIEYELADVRRCLRPAAAPTYFQPQHARKQYPTTTGGHGVAIAERGSVTTHNWIGADPLLRNFQGYGGTS